MRRLGGAARGGDPMSGSAIGAAPRPPSPRSTWPRRASIGLTEEEYDRLRGFLGRAPTLDRARHHLGALVRALLLQVVEGLPARVPDLGPARAPGAGRERRRRRHRPRLGGGLQDGVAQPPELHRALPGRGDRRRRHPARRLHHGRAADRLHGLAALRRRSTRRACARWSTAWCAASATTATASASRRSAARPASTAATTATSWSTPSRSASRGATGSSAPRRPASATRSSTPAAAPAATASTAPRWPRTSFDAESEKKRPTVQVGDPFTEKILLEACLEAMRTGGHRGDPGHGRRRPHQLDLRDGGARRRRLPPRPRPGAAARAGPDALRDDALRVAGAHGHGRRSAAREEEVARGLPQVGARGGDDRRGDRPTGRARDPPPRQGRGRHADRAADRRGAALPAPGRRAARSRRAGRRRPRSPSRRIPRRALERLLATPELGSKEWIWRQYDHTVRTNTVRGPGGDAAVLLLKGTPTGLALDLRRQPGLLLRSIRAAAAGRRWPRRCATWPASAPSRSGSPTASTSATPRSRRSRGSSARRSAACPRPAARSACRSSRATSRSTTRPRAARSTRRRRSAMVGVIAEPRRRRPAPHFRRAGDRVVLLGEDRAEFGGSAYLRLLYGVEQGRPPEVDLDAEARLGELLRAAVAAAASCARRTTSPRAASRWRSPRRRSAAGVGARLRRAARADALFLGDPGAGDRRRRAGRARAVPARGRGARRAGARRRRGRRRPAGRSRPDGATLDAPGRRACATLWSTALPRRPRAADRRDVRHLRHRGQDDAANLTYLGLYALQHRGQESAGIVSWDGRRMHARARHGARRRHLPGGGARAPARPPRHRPHPLLDRRLVGGRQRAADRGQDLDGTDRDRPQRQPDQRRGAPAAAGARRLDLPDHQRHRGDPPPDGAQPARRRGRVADGRARGGRRGLLAARSSPTTA